MCVAFFWFIYIPHLSSLSESGRGGERKGGRESDLKCHFKPKFYDKSSVDCFKKCSPACLDYRPAALLLLKKTTLYTLLVQ